MLTTLEDLKRLRACDQGMRFIQRFYPDGFEVEKLVTERHIPDDFLHWAKENLYCSEEVLEKYRNRLGIQNSDFYYYSRDINNCKYIKRSKKINNSQHVFYGQDVNNSRNIIRSKQVLDSNEIYECSFIVKSNKIYKSENITESSNIVRSKMVVNSSGVADSYNIFESSDIVKGINLTNCRFCVNVTNSQNCLFCSNISDKQYYIFNKPVDKQRFEYFLQQYKLYVGDRTISPCRQWPKTELLIVEMPKINPHQVMYYKEFDSDFWAWVKTLPGFDPELLYELTILPDTFTS